MIVDSRVAVGTFARDSDSVLADAILRTIRYADLFEQAVSKHEVLRYLDTQADEKSIFRVLAEYSGEMWLEYEGLYCLPGRLEVTQRTQNCAQVARPAWLHARRWAVIMAHIPFVRMIGVTGSLAMNNMARGADIDYFVVTAPGRVWSTRFLLVAVVRLARAFGQELCPNYVLSASALKIEDRTLFTARELTQMVPLFGDASYAQLMQMNDWTRTYLPHAGGHPQRHRIFVLGRLSRTMKTVLEKILGAGLFNRFERWEMRIKIARLGKLPGAVPPNVILNAEQCKGHFRATHRSLADRLDNPRA
jgi:hypothetical protein